MIWKIEEFIDKKTVDALSVFITSNDEKAFSDATDIILQAFGFDNSSFLQHNTDEENKLTVSFKNNLALLIQKTWVEKTDIELKERILYQLEQFRVDSAQTWKASYAPFLDILYNAVYLMFGDQVHTGDFNEYALRIDPEFGTYWWYVGSLPRSVDWPEKKCRDAVLIGMYFLANY